jgi:hypothetical protein
MVLEWRPVFHLAEMISARGCQKPQLGPFAKKVVVRKFARANDGILANTDPELNTMNTENDSEMKKEA